MPHRCSIAPRRLAWHALCFPWFHAHSCAPGPQPGDQEEGTAAVTLCNFMETLRMNENSVARDVAGHIRRAPETTHYRDLPDQELFTRVHRVVSHLYTRPDPRLYEDGPKNSLGAWYSRLGQERSRQGVPLGEVVVALSFIRKKIMRCVGERMLLDEGISDGQAARLYWSVSLFFDAVAGAVAEGYLKEPVRETCLTEACE